MSNSPKDDPVLVRLRRALDEMYGRDVERVVLFGSRARGDARPDSDYDVAVFLRGMADRFAEAYRLADLGTDILADTGAFVHAMPVPRRLVRRAHAAHARAPAGRRRPVRPETAAFLDAGTMLGVGLAEDAGRAAYLAGLHAAQALLFERTGRAFKKHASVRGEFGRLARDDPRFDAELRAFLGRAYVLKAVADYETGPGPKVSPELAGRAVETTERLRVRDGGAPRRGQPGMSPGCTTGEPAGSGCPRRPTRISRHPQRRMIGAGAAIAAQSACPDQIIGL